MPPPPLPPPPSAEVCWEPVDGGWCGDDHPGQAGYDADSGAPYLSEGGNWKSSDDGWRFCGVSLEQCQAACIAMGDCAEVSFTSNLCCFPATEQCHGSERTNDQKYHVVACPPPPPLPAPPAATPSPPLVQVAFSAPPPSSSPPPPSAEPPATTCWRETSEDDSWCGLDHPGQAEYDEYSGAAFVELFGGNWRLDTSHGWRYCGLTAGECIAACLGMADRCAELDFASNGCCFPATRTCSGNKRTKDRKFHRTDCTQAEATCESIEDNPGEQEYKGSSFRGSCAALADGVTSIGEQAFEQANFNYISIPPSVTSISKQAFKQINEGESEALFSWPCNPSSGSIPILEGVVATGDDWLQDTAAVYEISCSIDINSIAVSSQSGRDSIARPYLRMPGDARPGMGVVSAIAARYRGPRG